MIVLSRHLQRRVGVETAQCGQVNVTTQDCNTHGELGSNTLHPLDEHCTLLLVHSCGVVVVQIIKKINTAIELVEQTTAHTEPLAHKLDRSNQRAAENVLKPCKTLNLSVGCFRSHNVRVIA